MRETSDKLIGELESEHDNLIDDYERKDLLYADHEDPFMSLFSKAKYDEMNDALVKKVNHNLNYVFCYGFDKLLKIYYVFLCFLNLYL